MNYDYSAALCQPECVLNLHKCTIPRGVVSALNCAWDHLKEGVPGMAWYGSHYSECKPCMSIEDRSLRTEAGEITVVWIAEGMIYIHPGTLFTAHCKFRPTRGGRQSNFVTVQFNYLS